jgi:hypothetical protein
MTVPHSREEANDLYRECQDLIEEWENILRDTGKMSQDEQDAYRELSYLMPALGWYYGWSEARMAPTELWVRAFELLPVLQARVETAA